MAERTIPHAYPMSLEYEMSNPRRIYDQNFAEGKKSSIVAPLLVFKIQLQPTVIAVILMCC